MRIEVSLGMSRPSAVVPSPRVAQVAAMFGLGVDETREVCVVPESRVPIAGGWIVFITGPSGGGKSTLLRLIADGAAARAGVRAHWLDRVAADADLPLVDCMGGIELPGALDALSTAGLNDAFVMLRKPSELSDGQRCRFRLALMLAQLDRSQTAPENEPRLDVVLADEFGATLDRLTASVLARSVRKWTRRRPRVCFVAATTHDDLLEPLEPDVLIDKRLGPEMHILTRAEGLA